MGFEPTTYGLQNRCSNQLSYFGILAKLVMEPTACPSVVQPLDEGGSYFGILDHYSYAALGYTKA